MSSKLCEVSNPHVANVVNYGLYTSHSEWTHTHYAVVDWLSNKKFPLIRGMVSYAVIWPSCSIIQEYIEHGTSLGNADWARATRFGVFGAFFMAPVFYGWMKFSSKFFKGKNLSTAVTRALVEQVSYSPAAMAYFFFGMSLLEMKPLKTCVNEVREKFWPTYKVGAVFWPTAQTINFYFVSERNRIVFVSFASFVWTIFMAHMKCKEQVTGKRNGANEIYDQTINTKDPD